MPLVPLARRAPVAPPKPAPVPSTTPQPAPPPARVVKRVPLALIVLRRRNPRIDSVESLRVADMTEAFDAVGQINAVTTRPVPMDSPRRKEERLIGLLPGGAIDRIPMDDPRRLDPNLVELVAGERRFRAACAARNVDIEAAVEPMDDARADDVAAIENQSRVPMSLWSVIHECARRCGVDGLGQDVEDVGRVMRLSPRDVRDYTLMHDDLAPELLAKLEHAPNIEVVRRLHKCATLHAKAAPSKEGRWYHQRAWYAAEMVRLVEVAHAPTKKKRTGTGAHAGRQRPGSRSLIAIADAIERDRRIPHPDSDTMLTLDPLTARAVAAVMRHAARPGKHPRPV